MAVAVLARLVIALGCVLPAMGGMKRPSNTVEDNHRYYTLSVYQNNMDQKFDEHFINMESANVREGLSNYMVGAEQIAPMFPFPFYGHIVNNFYITTHGFLSLSNRLHDYIYKTQYIAPLRIKLDPSRSNSSTISVLSLPDRFTVEWSNVSVMASAEHHTGGSFTFQVTLKPNGDIIFVYIDVQPVLTTAALYDMEPVAGISDAFLLNDSELHLYNKINIDNVDINTRTVALFTALPTCVAAMSCEQCAYTRNTTTFDCNWCESAGHCSDGADRLRQAWNDNQCHLANSTTCPGHAEWRSSVSASMNAGSSSSDSNSGSSSSSTGVVVSAVVSTLLAVVLVGLLLGFFYVYGRYNERTMAGRYLKRLQASYQRFGAAAKNTSLELGRKRTELLVGKTGAAQASTTANNTVNNNNNTSKPVSEFVNPHPMSTVNNNVITANM